MTDAALIARVLGGDAEAFAGLVERYYQDCARFAGRMLGNREDAEDALQETFLKAYGALGRYRDQDRFRAWLYRILINQCRTVARQRRRQRNRLAAAGELASPLAPAAADAVVLSDALQGALDRLDPALREAVLLKYGEGLEYPEIAALTGAGISALKMRVKRACEALRPNLEEWKHDR